MSWGMEKVLLKKRAFIMFQNTLNQSKVISLDAFRAAKEAAQEYPVAYPPQFEPLDNPVQVTGYSFGLDPRDLNDLKEVLRKLRYYAIDPVYDWDADSEDLWDLQYDLEKINPWPSRQSQQVYSDMKAAVQKPQPLLHLMKVWKGIRGRNFPVRGTTPPRTSDPPRLHAGA